MKNVCSGKTKSGKKFIIRYPQKEDLEAMRNYINTLSKEQTYIRYQGEQVSLEKEKEFLDKMLRKIEDKQAVQLLVFIDRRIAGVSSVEMRDKVEKHVGGFGISLSKECRGQGIGKLLMEKVVNEAKKWIPDLKIITLEVYSENEIAQSLYKKFGFIQYGVLPKGIAYKGRFIDCILMYKNIN